jgi:hypothetical protein
MVTQVGLEDDRVHRLSGLAAGDPMLVASGVFVRPGRDRTVPARLPPGRAREHAGARRDAGRFPLLRRRALGGVTPPGVRAGMPRAARAAVPGLVTAAA